MNGVDIKKLPLRITYTNVWGKTWEGYSSVSIEACQTLRFVQVLEAHGKFTNKSNYQYKKTEPVWIPTDKILKITHNPKAVSRTSAVEKHEDIFGERWVETPNGGNLQVGDKVKLFDGRCNNVEAIDGGSFLIPSSDKWLSRRVIQYVWC